MKLKHALLIDDNEVDNFISKHVIIDSKMAEKVTVMNSAIEALEYLSTLDTISIEFPDTIFLDIRMPVMDGFEFLVEYAKFSKDSISKPRIYMLTTSSDAVDINRASKIPFVKKYLNKPLDLATLQNL